MFQITLCPHFRKLKLKILFYLTLGLEIVLLRHPQFILQNLFEVVTNVGWFSLGDSVFKQIFMLRIDYSHFG
jgi:hypothetical protein